MIDIKYKQNGPAPRNVEFELNGNCVLITGCEIHIKASVEEPLTKITITGFIENAEMEFENLRPENLSLEGNFYVKKTARELVS